MAYYERNETRGYRQPEGVIRYWFPVIGAELAWTSHLLLGYVFSPVLCRNGFEWGLFAASAVFLVIAASAVLLAAHDWRDVSRFPHDERDVAMSRTGFLMSQGVYLGVLMLFGIVASTVAMATVRC